MGNMPIPQNSGQDLGISGKMVAGLIILPLIAVSIGIWIVLRITADAPAPAASKAQPTVKTVASSPAPVAAVIHVAAPIQSPSSRTAAQMPVVPTVAISNPPAPPPIPVPQFGSISGAAWLARNDGSSNVQRGLHVQVLRPGVLGTVIIEILNEEAKPWQADADENKRQAEENRRLFGATSFDVYGDEAKRAQKGADKARDAIKDVPSAEVDLLDAYKFVKAVAHYGLPVFEAAVKDSLVVDVKTDVDGKYRIDQVTEGTYYLHAKIDSKSLFAEWLVPIRIHAGEAIKLDIDNENAVAIQN